MENAPFSVKFERGKKTIPLSMHEENASTLMDLIGIQKFGSSGRGVARELVIPFKKF